MSKEINYRIRASKCGDKNCRCVVVNLNDYVHGQRSIESKAIKHKAANNKIKLKGHDGCWIG